MLSPKGLPRSKRQLSQTWISSNIASLSDRLYETFARHCLLDQRISIYALTYAPIVVDILAECPLRCEAMMSTAVFSRYLFTTHVEPLNPLSLEVALNALRNPPVPNGSGSIEKSTIVGLPVRAITDMSKLKISAEVVVSVMSFPNFSMSTTDRLCGTNLHGIWNDALWGTDVTAAPVFPCPAFSPWEMSLIYRFCRPRTPAETSIGASLTLPSMNHPWILFNVGNCFTEEQESPCYPASASQDIVSDIP